MRRAPWVLLGLGVLAVAEIALLVWVAGEIGVLWTLLVLQLWLAKHKPTIIP